LSATDPQAPHGPGWRGWGRAARTVGLILLVGALGLFAWWWRDLRLRPHVLRRSGAAVERLLYDAGWVTEGVEGGPVLYMVAVRRCPDCLRIESEEFSRLQRAGVDLRVVMVAPRFGSTSIERATVAELWDGRDWQDYETWTGTAERAWTAPDIPPADGDPRRIALVERGRSLVDRLRPLLAQDGLRFGYPLLVWRDPRGQVRACTCRTRDTYAYIRRDLGAPS